MLAPSTRAEGGEGGGDSYGRQAVSKFKWTKKLMRRCLQQ